MIGCYIYPPLKSGALGAWGWLRAGMPMPHDEEGLFPESIALPLPLKSYAWMTEGLDNGKTRKVCFSTSHWVITSFECLSGAHMRRYFVVVIFSLLLHKTNNGGLSLTQSLKVYSFLHQIISVRSHVTGCQESTISPFRRLKWSSSLLSAYHNRLLTVLRTAFQLLTQSIRLYHSLNRVFFLIFRFYKVVNSTNVNLKVQVLSWNVRIIKHISANIVEILVTYRCILAENLETEVVFNSGTYLPIFEKKDRRSKRSTPCGWRQ